MNPASTEMNAEENDEMWDAGILFRPMASRRMISSIHPCGRQVQAQLSVTAAVNECIQNAVQNASKHTVHQLDLPPMRRMK